MFGNWTKHSFFVFDIQHLKPSIDSCKENMRLFQTFKPRKKQHKLELRRHHAIYKSLKVNEFISTRKQNIVFSLHTSFHSHIKSYLLFVYLEATSHKCLRLGWKHVVKSKAMCILLFKNMEKLNHISISAVQVSVIFP